MKAAIRPADLKSDRRLIIAAIGRFLTTSSDDHRFGWLYENNPAGNARVWVAHSETETIGIAAAFPRRIYVGSREELCWVLGDFCMDGRYRSLGPALQLQLVCLAAAKAEGVQFCYDFPSQGMMAVYKRLGIPASYRVVRLAKPLRLDRSLRKLVKWTPAAQGLTAIGNLYLSCRNSNTNHDRSLEIACHQGPCGEEFSTLANEIKGQQGICVAHSAEYLNWRYLENPLHRYGLFTARRDGNLLGYAVLLHQGDDALLVDLFGAQDDAVVDALIFHVTALLLKGRIQTLSVVLAEAHPRRPILERLGFKVRETSPMVIHYPAGKPSGEQRSDEKFLFMHGDRDS